PVLREVLRNASRQIDAKLLGNLPPAVEERNSKVAWFVIIVVMAGFALMFRKVFRAFTPPHEQSRSSWQFSRYGFAYLLMLPALVSIALWLYYPLARGTVMAFQDYSVLGDSRFVGAQNFASVLFSGEFWHSVRVSLIYAGLFLIFGFWVPIALAFLLQEVPRGKVLFRTIYYLPAVLSGLVVIFL